MRFDAALNALGKARIVRDQDRLRGDVMFGLRQEVGGDPVRIRRLVGEDQDLGGARDHVDADFAEHKAFGRGDIGISGSDDLRHGRNRLRAVSKRRHRLCAADTVDLVDPGEIGSRQDERVELAVRRGHDHDEPRHARHFRRHSVHQNGGGISRGAPRHVKPYGFDRRPTITERHADRIDIAVILRQLAAVVGLNAAVRELERRERGGIAGFARVLQLGLLHGQAGAHEIDAVELERQFDQSAIAPLRDIGDNGADRLLDIGRRLAFPAKKEPERVSKTARSGVETDRPPNGSPSKASSPSATTSASGAKARMRRKATSSASRKATSPDLRASGKLRL